MTYFEGVLIRLYTAVLKYTITLKNADTNIFHVVFSVGFLGMLNPGQGLTLLHLHRDEDAAYIHYFFPHGQIDVPLWEENHPKQYVFLL